MAFTLFLDFDGVLNGDQNSQSTLARSNLAALDLLCQRLPVVKIVVTSTWRLGRTPEQLQKMLGRDGFRAVHLVQDVTPSLGSGRGIRTKEIRAWMAKHKPERILIIDDMDMSADWGAEFAWIDSNTGLTEARVTEIMQQLGLSG